MSLSIARNIATSALWATQTQMSVTASNIANADSAGYTRKVATQVAVVSAGSGAGTTITNISGKVDALLLKSLLTANASLGAAETSDNYAERLQALFGSVSGSGGDTGTSLANTIAALETALTQLADTPESSTLAANVVDSLDQVAIQLRDTSDGIQSLRADADQAIATTVDEVNQALETIGDLNKAIVKAAAAGQPTGDLEDQRNSALETISSAMDVSWFVNSSGAMQVYTTSGQPLVDGTVHALTYEAAATVTAESTYSATPPSGFSGIVVDGKDVTAQIKSGTLAALVSQRDDVLPAAQEALDQLATTLAATLNAAHNTATALPPPQSLTGSQTVSATDALSATGSVRFAVTDSSGTLVSYQDLDLSTYGTVGDLVAAIDGIAGLSATIDSSGHVVVSADDSANGVAINEMTSAVGSDGAGLSAWLGLNDLVTATGASDFSVRRDIAEDTALFSAATLDGSATLAAGQAVLTSGSSTAAQAMHDALTGNSYFAAAGDLGSTTDSIAGYAASLVANVASGATKAASALSTATSTQSGISDALSSQTGVNLDEETARMSELENAYAVAAQLIQVLNSMFNTLLETVKSA